MRGASVPAGPTKSRKVEYLSSFASTARVIEEMHARCADNKIIEHFGKPSVSPHWEGMRSNKALARRGAKLDDREPF
jgi:hypothetical protein